MKQLFCKATDDDGKVCNNPMSEKESKQDGMCTRCAELIWSNFAQPLCMGKEPKPIIFPTV